MLAVSWALRCFAKGIAISALPGSFVWCGIASACRRPLRKLWLNMFAVPIADICNFWTENAPKTHASRVASEELILAWVNLWRFLLRMDAPISQGPATFVAGRPRRRHKVTIIRNPQGALG
jgi:hypothetical protein